MKKFKRFLKNNQWIFIAIIDIALLLTFFAMLASWVIDYAEFYAFMKIYAG